MPLTVPQIEALLARAGYVPHDQTAHFGSTLPGVLYVYRKDELGQHTYVSVVTYGGALCELIWETYLAPKNTRTPKGRDTKPAKAGDPTDWMRRGFVPVGVGILRDEPTIRAFCE